MKRLVRTGCAGCVAVLAAAGAPSVPAALAQSPVEVQTIVSVPPPREEGGVVAAPAPATVAPWDRPPWSPLAGMPDPVAPDPIADASQPSAPSSSVSTNAFTGAATPLRCRSGAYRAIIDERTDLPFGTLCELPDGTWRLLP